MNNEERKKCSHTLSAQQTPYTDELMTLHLHASTQSSVGFAEPSTCATYTSAHTYAHKLTKSLRVTPQHTETNLI